MRYRPVHLALEPGLAGGYFRRMDWEAQIVVLAGRVRLSRQAWVSEAASSRWSPALCSTSGVVCGTVDRAWMRSERPTYEQTTQQSIRSFVGGEGDGDNGGLIGISRSDDSGTHSAPIHSRPSVALAR